jgi:hypothetical protein
MDKFEYLGDKVTTQNKKFKNIKELNRNILFLIKLNLFNN